MLQRVDLNPLFSSWITKHHCNSLSTLEILLAFIYQIHHFWLLFFCLHYFSSPDSSQVFTKRFGILISFLASETISDASLASFDAYFLLDYGLKGGMRYAPKFHDPNSGQDLVIDHEIPSPPIDQYLIITQVLFFSIITETVNDRNYFFPLTSSRKMIIINCLFLGRKLQGFITYLPMKYFPRGLASCGRVPKNLVVPTIA